MPMLGNAIAVGRIAAAPTSWDPADFGTVVMDIDFSNSDTVTLNGTDLSAITCQAGTGRDFAQSTASKQPAYTGQLFDNGKQCAFFHDDGIQDDSWPSDIAAGKHTIFVVQSPASGAVFDDFFMDALTVGFRMQLGQNQTTDGVSYNDDTGVWAAIGTAGTAGDQLITYQLDSATVSEVFRNGVSLGTDTYTDTAIGTGTHCGIGASNAIGSSFLQNTKLGRVLIFSPALSSADRASVEALLQRDWSI